MQCHGVDFEYALPDPVWVVSGYTATSTLLGNEKLFRDPAELCPLFSKTR